VCYAPIKGFANKGAVEDLLQKIKGLPMKKIGYFGAGTWGIALASILVENGHSVLAWTREEEFAAFCKARVSTQSLPVSHFQTNSPYERSSEGDYWR